MPRQRSTFTATFIDDLSRALYHQKNIDRANEYLSSRKLNPLNLKFPWTATGSDPAEFNYFRGILPPVIFCDCLYIPIVEIDSDPENPVLGGFDVRFLGDQAHRLRWAKRRRDVSTEFLYNAHTILTVDQIIVAEGAMDVESFRLCGYEAISPLGSLFSPRFVHFLYATECEIYLAYDNDSAGHSAQSKILEYVSRYVPAQVKFHTLIYPYKDPNECLQKLGTDGLKAKIDCQLRSY